MIARHPPSHSLGGVSLSTWAVLATWLAVPNPYLLTMGAIVGLLVVLRTSWRPPPRPEVVLVGLALVSSIAFASIIGEPPPLSRGLPLALALTMAAFFSQSRGVALKDFFAGSLLAGFVYLIGSLLSALGVVSAQYGFVDKGTGSELARFGAFGLDPNFSSAILVLILAVCVATRRYVASSRGYYIFLILLPVGIVSSASRMALAMGAVLYAWLGFRRFKLGSLFLAALIPFLLVNKSIQDALYWTPALRKVAGTDAGSMQSDNLRSFLWSQGVEQILDGRIFGVGWGRADQLNEEPIGRPITFHSSWLTVPIELGLLGALTAGVILAVCAVALARRLRFDSIPLILSFAVMNSFVSLIYAVGPFALPLILGVFSLHIPKVASSDANTTPQLSG